MNRILSILLLFGGLFLSKFSGAQNYVRDTRFWQPNSVVKDVLIDSTNNFVYIGGAFNYIGPPVPFGAILDSNNVTIENTPAPNAEVYTSIPDGTGGWYIGGNFTKIGNSNRLRIAHIDSNGNLADSLGVIGFSESVRSLCLNDTILYVGGDFVTFGGVTRNHAAAINITTNSLHFWNPSADFPVNELLIKDSLLFVVGEFTSISNSQRNGLALYNLNNFSLHSYSPNHNGNILCAALDSNFLYLGGTFLDYDNQPRNRLAKINISNFVLQSWNPSADNYVFSIAINDTNVFLGGNFTQINGSSRINLANVDKSSGQLLSLSFSPNLNGAISTSGIYKLATKDSFLLVGADYNTQGFYDDFKHFFFINLNSGSIDPYSPQADGPIKTISFSNQRMYVGGEFASAGGNSVDKIARFDLTTGKLSNWRSKVVGNVFDLLLLDSVIVAVGNIPLIGADTCGNIAKLSTTNGQNIPFPVVTGNTDPFSPKSIKSVEKIGDTLIFSGEFNTVNGLIRNQIAAVNFSNGGLLNWSPSLPYGTGKLAVYGNKVYSAGSNVYRFSKNSLALDTNWQFNCGNPINQIIPFDSVIVLLNQPYGIGNSYHTGFTMLDTVFGSVLNEQENLFAEWYAGFVSDNSIFLSGRIINQVTNPFGLSKVYEVNKITRDTLSGPFPIFGMNNVERIQKNGTKLFLGGLFSSFDGHDIPNFVVLDVCEPSINHEIEQVTECNAFTWLQNNVTYYSSGMYSELLVNSEGCDSIVFLSLEILKDSTIDIITACNSYTWLNGTTYYSSNNSAFVNYTNSSGCDSTIWLNLSILPSPIANVSNTNGTLTASGLGTYQWLNCSLNELIFGEFDQSYIPSQNGFYAVILNNGNCSDTSDCIAVTNLGINEIEYELIYLHPNPTSNQVTITMSAPSANLRVYDIQGKLVAEQKVVSGSEVSLKDFETGIYLFEVISEGNRTVKRVVINK